MSWHARALPLAALPLAACPSARSAVDIPLVYVTKITRTSMTFVCVKPDRTRPPVGAKK